MREGGGVLFHRLQQQGYPKGCAGHRSVVVVIVVVVVVLLLLQSNGGAVHVTISSGPPLPDTCGYA